MEQAVDADLGGAMEIDADYSSASDEESEDGLNGIVSSVFELPARRDDVEQMEPGGVLPPEPDPGSDSEPDSSTIRGTRDTHVQGEDKRRVFDAIGKCIVDRAYHDTGARGCIQKAYSERLKECVDAIESWSRVVPTSFDVDGKQVSGVVQFGYTFSGFSQPRDSLHNCMVTRKDYTLGFNVCNTITKWIWVLPKVSITVFYKQEDRDKASLLSFESIEAYEHFVINVDMAPSATWDTELLSWKSDVDQTYVETTKRSHKVVFHGNKDFMQHVTSGLKERETFSDDIATFLVEPQQLLRRLKKMPDLKQDMYSCSYNNLRVYSYIHSKVGGAWKQKQIACKNAPYLLFEMPLLVGSEHCPTSQPGAVRQPWDESLKGLLIINGQPNYVPGKVSALSRMMKVNMKEDNITGDIIYSCCARTTFASDLYINVSYSDKESKYTISCTQKAGAHIAVDMPLGSFMANLNISLLGENLSEESMTTREHEADNDLSTYNLRKKTSYYILRGVKEGEKDKKAPFEHDKRHEIEFILNEIIARIKKARIMGMKSVEMNSQAGRRVEYLCGMKEQVTRTLYKRLRDVTGKQFDECDAKDRSSRIGKALAQWWEKPTEEYIIELRKVLEIYRHRFVPGVKFWKEHTVVAQMQNEKRIDVQINSSTNAFTLSPQSRKGEASHWACPVHTNESDEPGKKMVFSYTTKLSNEEKRMHEYLVDVAGVSPIATVVRSKWRNRTNIILDDEWIGVEHKMSASSFAKQLRDARSTGVFDKDVSISSMDNDVIIYATAGRPLTLLLPIKTERVTTTPTASTVVSGRATSSVCNDRDWAKDGDLSTLLSLVRVSEHGSDKKPDVHTAQKCKVSCAAFDMFRIVEGKKNRCFMCGTKHNLAKLQENSRVYKDCDHRFCGDCMVDEVMQYGTSFDECPICHEISEIALVNLNLTGRLIGKILGKKDWTIDDLARAGKKGDKPLVEYKDPSEMANCLIAETIEEAEAMMMADTAVVTHIEVHPVGKLGAHAGSHVFSHHNPGVRRIYSHHQLESYMPLLISQRGLCESMDGKQSGDCLNVKVVIRGDHECREDGCAVRKHFAERRGLTGDHTLRDNIFSWNKKMMAVCNSSNLIDGTMQVVKSKRILQVPKVGDHVDPSKTFCVFQVMEECSPLDTEVWIDTMESMVKQDVRQEATHCASYHVKNRRRMESRHLPMKYRKGLYGTVTKVTCYDERGDIVSSDESGVDITTVIAEVEGLLTLQIGDKIYPLHAQKTTLSYLNSLGFFCGDDGLPPDLVLNTHSFPSRMTIGYILEMLYSDEAARGGFFVDGTPMSSNIPLRDLLKRFGNKTTKLYSNDGVCIGKAMTGYVRYHGSGHQARKKLNTNSSGERDDIGNYKSNRMGEMETHITLGNHQYELVKRMSRQNSTYIDVCSTCSEVAVYCRCAKESDQSIVTIPFGNVGRYTMSILRLFGYSMCFGFSDKTDRR